MARQRKRVGRRRALARFSIEELRAEMERRRRDRIRQLRRERAEHQKAIAALDAQIAALTEGGRPVRKRAPARKTRRPRRLTRMAMKRLQGRVADIVSKAKEGVAISDLAAAVRSSVPRVRTALRNLLAEKKVVKRGERRATKYFPPNR